MAAQTFKNYEWIVVDDCTPATVCTMNQRYFTGPERWTENNNTQRVNMNLALSKVRGDFIFVIEDDEYYAPQYLQTMMSAFTHSAIVGLSNAHYYKINMPGYSILRNFQHASLSQTAIRKDILQRLKDACNTGHFYFDIELWKRCRNEGVPMTLIGNTSLSIGIKGMPGRGGLTPPHKENKGFLLDSGYKVLEKWLGPAIKNYEPFLRKRVVKKHVAA